MPNETWDWIDWLGFACQIITLVASVVVIILVA